MYNYYHWNGDIPVTVPNPITIIMDKLMMIFTIMEQIKICSQLCYPLN